MRTVIIESPYSSPDPLIVARNVRYAKMCMKDSLDRGEAPFLSHLLYTWVYDDQIPALREAGIQAGLEIGKRMDATIVYTDLGISPGMEKGIEDAKRCGRSIEYRMLGGREWLST